ncbi:MAG: hypothetical protein ACRES3_06170 [Steroidobacteraceae bacterium]
MADDASLLRRDLEAVSRALQAVHTHILEAEGPYLPGLKGLALLDRLINDPEWAWLRALSMLIADLDEALAKDTDLTSGEAAAAAGHARALVFGLGEPRDEPFLNRYRPLLQASAALASAHGELKRLIDAMPPEPLNASEKLHARHVWAMRCKHRLQASSVRSDNQQMGDKP